MNDPFKGKKKALSRLNSRHQRRNLARTMDKVRMEEGVGRIVFREELKTKPEHQWVFKDQKINIVSGNSTIYH